MGLEEIMGMPKAKIIVKLKRGSTTTKKALVPETGFDRISAQQLVERQDARAFDRRIDGEYLDDRLETSNLQVQMGDQFGHLY